MKKKQDCEGLAFKALKSVELPVGDLVSKVVEEASTNEGKKKLVWP